MNPLSFVCILVGMMEMALATPSGSLAGTVACRRFEDGPADSNGPHLSGMAGVYSAVIAAVNQHVDCQLPT